MYYPRSEQQQQFTTQHMWTLLIDASRTVTEGALLICKAVAESCPCFAQGGLRPVSLHAVAARMIDVLHIWERGHG